MYLQHQAATADTPVNERQRICRLALALTPIATYPALLALENLAIPHPIRMIPLTQTV
jgi:hypothetical protein